MIAVFSFFTLRRLAYAALFVVVDERERQRDVERSALERTGGSLARFECGHQVHPAGRPLHLERLDELAAKYRDQQPLELHVDTYVRQATELLLARLHIV